MDQGGGRRKRYSENPRGASSYPGRGNVNRRSSSSNLSNQGSLLEPRRADDRSGGSNWNPRQFDDGRQNRGRGRGRGGGGFPGNRGDRDGDSHFRQPRGGDGGGAGFNSGPERKHPMGFKQLEELLTKPAKDVIMAVVNEKSGFPMLLSDVKLRDDRRKMAQVLRLLATALDSQGFDNLTGRAVSVVVDNKFLDSLVNFNLGSMSNVEDPQIVDQIVSHQVIIFEQIIQISPDNYATNLRPSVNSLQFAINGAASRGITVNQPSLDTLARVVENLDELMRKHEPDRNADLLTRQERIRRKLEADHELAPPEDFRTLPVVPAVAELLSNDKPFIRCNIKHGRYRDADHYLDVQFRLMKEDFVRPLRDGIREVVHAVGDDGSLASKRKRFQDVRVYEEGRVTNVAWARNGMTLELRFSTKKLGKVRWEITKRLMFGSLLCLTPDGFKSVLFASVADRKAEEMEKGIIKIRPEFPQLDVNAWTGKQFLIVESSAFFEAYRHFLSSLQKMALARFPMKKYLVDVDTQTNFPAYLLAAEDTEARYIPLSHASRNRAFQLEADPFTNSWPSALSLSLDDAQFRAFRAGLTREFSLIQGPPGTGKTYIGLKLVETILERRRVHKMVDEGPIFVVCLTNHALDQFLEGMLPFTRKMLRIGNRCQNKALEPFTAREMQRTMANATHGCRDGIQMQRDISFAVRRIESDVARDTLVRDGVSSGAGILNRDSILSVDPLVVLPAEFDAAVWLGLDRAREFPDRFVRQVFESEKEHVTAKLARLHYRQQQDDGEDVNADADGEEDLLDADIEDQNAVEASRREVESLYETDLKPAAPTDAEAKKFLSLVFGTSLHELEAEINAAKLVLNELNAQFAAYQQLVEIGQMRPGEFESWRSSNQIRYFEADVSWRRAANLVESLKAAVPLLQVPTSFDLEYPREVRPGVGVANAQYKTRWLLYRYWANRFARSMSTAIHGKMDEYRVLCGQLEEARNAALLEMIRSLDIVGMTTTGAAKNITVVQNMGAKIVVVEEAAEVLESHIVCCLSRSCQHLILIGDHQQLKPSPTVYQLAKEYNLDVSLFERMLNNGVPCERLRTQHRMRPEISRLLKPHIYEDLEDHESVHTYPDVRGMRKNVFFVTHQNWEESNDDLKSHSNLKEAEFLLAVCRYLLLQGYTKDEITILTAYSGQLFVFKKLLNNFPTCKGVRITLVDNFQGEENIIILLSLVRSNTEGNVGFLKEENRVNVALSRAKHGLFIVGNIDALCGKGQKSGRENELWVKVRAALEAQDSFGAAVPLRCQIHPDQITSAFAPSQFPAGGGCSKKCNMPLKCGHLCYRVCHVIDKEHVTVESTCKLRCERKCAAGTHDCISICGKQPCPPCLVSVTRALVPCGHEQETRCYEDVQKVRCKTKCIARLECGHTCAKLCHSKDDPEHLKYKCERGCEEECKLGHKCKGPCYEKPCKPCSEVVKKVLPCGHERDVLCHVDPAAVVCTKKCQKTLPCTHPCKRKCNDACGGCDVVVEKVIPDCYHSVKMACGDMAERSKCEKMCERNLPCGHRCPKKCAEACEAKCKQGIRFESRARCGHFVDMPCHIHRAKTVWNPVDLMTFCKSPCTAVLDCGHPCSGTCSECFQGRIHAPCKQPCQRPLVCGHVCKVPCAQNCPPCQEKCRYKCEHSQCPKTCGDPCARCKEKCKRSCPHLPCRKKCSDQCHSPDRCDEPCAKKLPCGHPCVGMCGEICPPCRKCAGEEVEFFDVLMQAEAEEDARFIYLPDCKHVIEVDGMDGWMGQKLEEIGHRRCPKCSAPILFSRRYKQEVDAAFEDVAAVRKRIFGERGNNMEMDRLIELLTDPKKDSAGSVIQRVFNDRDFWKLLVVNELGHEPYQPVAKPKHGQGFGSKRKRLSAMQLENISNRIRLLEALGKLVEHVEIGKGKLSGPRSRDFLTSFKTRVLLIADMLMERKNSLNDGVLQGFSAEIQRLKLFADYEKLKECCHSAAAVSMLDRAEEILSDITFFTDDREKEVRRLLNDASKLVGGLGVTDDERRMILGAMGLRQGHWYKCPNGHIYCITECGGANQESKCNECGAAIGGVSYRLLPNNAVASEMDGAVHAVWSEANNLANFDPNQFQD